MLIQCHVCMCVFNDWREHVRASFTTHSGDNHG